jgi:WD repeat-containing protein 61
MGWTKHASYLGHRGAIYALQSTSNPHLFLSGSGDGHVVRWDVRSPERGDQIADTLKAIFSLHHDVGRKLLFIGNEEGGLHMIDLVAQEEVRLLKAHKRGIFRIVPLGADRILCTGGDGLMSVWNVPSMELIRHVPLSDEKIRGVAVSADGAQIAVACLDGSIRILDSTDFNEQHTLAGHVKGAASVSWHPNKPVLISGGRDGHLRFWRSDAGFAPLHDFAAHRANIYGIAFNSDASLCATASRDKTVKIWDAATFEPLERFDLKTHGHTHSVNVVQWCNDGSLLSASDDRSILRWARA